MVEDVRGGARERAGSMADGVRGGRSCACEGAGSVADGVHGGRSGARHRVRHWSGGDYCRNRPRAHCETLLSAAV